MTSTTTDLGNVNLARTFPADRETVFRAYVDPVQFAQFWGPVGTSVPLESVTIEPWAGGRFDSTMVVDATGDSYPIKGVFVEVVEPSLLTFSETGEAEGMVCHIRLADLGEGGTEVRLEQTGVPAMYRSAEALAGLESSLDRLGEHLARGTAANQR